MEGQMAAKRIYFHTICENIAVDMMVNDLILEGYHQWNFSLIKDIFVEEDWKLILSTPLRSSSNADRLIWHYNNNGHFSVRSAYHFALRIEQNEYFSTNQLFHGYVQSLEMAMGYEASIQN